MGKGQVVSGGLLKARENPTELLELIEEALDQVTFFVEVLVVFTLLQAVGLGRYHNLGTLKLPRIESVAVKPPE